MTKRSLSDSDVEKVRELYATGDYTQKEIGEMFNCTAMTISLWLPVNDTKRVIKFGPRIHKEPPSYDPDELQKIKELRMKGYNSMKVSQTTGIELGKVNEMFGFLAGLI